MIVLTMPADLQTTNEYQMMYATFEFWISFIAIFSLNIQLIVQEKDVLLWVNTD